MMLHIALALFIMAITIIILNNVISMALAICLCLDLMAVLYTAVDHGAEMLGVEGFQMMEYTITGKIAMLPMVMGTSDIRTSLVIAAAFIVGSLAVCGAVFQKRDIN